MIGETLRIISGIVDQSVFLIQFAIVENPDFVNQSAIVDLSVIVDQSEKISLRAAFFVITSQERSIDTIKSV